MKANDQILNVPAKLARSVKTHVAKAGKAIRKSTSSAKKVSRKGTKPTAQARQSALSGYSDSASRFIGRARSALGEAYSWVGVGLARQPKLGRHVRMPVQRTILAFINEKPLIVGAVGLGLGFAMAAMLPLSHSAASSKQQVRKASRRK